MVKKVKEYNVLDVEDVEKAVSKMLGRPVKVGEMDVTLSDLLPLASTLDNRIEDCGLGVCVEVDDDVVCDDDWNGPLDELIPDEVGLDVSYIFNFSTDLFHSFTRDIDESD